ncbi:MAG: hypothetical protein ACOYON_08680 [Fimbriimonas sp.]
MKLTLVTSCMALSAIVLSASVANTGALQASINQSTTHGMAVAYPWVFQKGHDTSKITAITSVEEIARKANYASVPADVAKAAWLKAGLPTPSIGNLPTAASLKKYGMALRANRVLYGSVSWHTRSIWVNAGPKTISTATVNVYVFDRTHGQDRLLEAQRQGTKR